MHRIDRSIQFAATLCRRRAATLAIHADYLADQARRRRDDGEPYVDVDQAEAYGAHLRFVEARDAWHDVETLRREMFGEGVG